MQRIATGRIVGLVIGIIGVGASIWYARDALQMNAEFHQWLDARPMETAIDLSQPGKITVPFHQTCSTSHGEALYLKCALDDETKQDIKGIFQDLSCNVVIKDSEGKEIDSVKIDKDSVQYWDNKILLASFSPFRTGHYFVTIRVDSGAAVLADKEQTLYAEYQLCGLEQMPAMVVGAFAFGAGIIGLVSTVCVLPGLLRGGFKRDASK